MKRADESKNTDQVLPKASAASKRPRKLYYKIGEVCELTTLPHHVIRFWEKEFPQLAPRKTSTGHRIFNDKDIEILLFIKELLYVRKFTIKGAREYILQGNTKLIKEPPKIIGKAAKDGKLLDRLNLIKKILERKPPN